MKGFRIKLDMPAPYPYSAELAGKIQTRLAQLRQGKKDSISFNEIRDIFESEIEADKKLNLKSDGFIEQILTDNKIEVIEC